MIINESYTIKWKISAISYPCLVSNDNNFISENNESIGVLILRFSGIEIDVICKADDSLLFLLLLHESNRKKSKEYKRTFVFMELVGLIKSNNH